MTNLEKYRSVLTDDVQGLFLTSRYSRMYAAEFDIAEGYAIVARNGAYYITDGRYIESAQKNIPGFTVVEFSASRPLATVVNELLAKLGLHTLGFEEDYTTVGELRSFEESFDAEFVPIQKKINVFRHSKETWELERMQQAQDITDRAFTEVCSRIHEGMTEKELCAELIYCLYKNGGEGLSFDPIVVSGPNTSMPHGVPGDRAIQKGDFVTMDFGVLYQGYCSDMTRTVAVGQATDEMKNIYAIVLKAQLAGIAAARAGIPGKEIDGAARKVIVDAGFGQYFGHGFGHSLGLDIHEAPSANPSGEALMPVGAVVSAEPGIYLPGKFGVRIEDVMVLNETGCEVITKAPKEQLIIL